MIRDSMCRDDCRPLFHKMTSRDAPHELNSEPATSVRDSSFSELDLEKLGSPLGQPSILSLFAALKTLQGSDFTLLQSQPSSSVVQTGNIAPHSESARTTLNAFRNRVAITDRFISLNNRSRPEWGPDLKTQSTVKYLKPQ